MAEVPSDSPSSIDLIVIDRGVYSAYLHDARCRKLYYNTWLKPESKTLDTTWTALDTGPIQKFTGAY